MKKLFLAAGIPIAASVAMAATITNGSADMTLPNFPGSETGQFSQFGTGFSFTGAGNTTSGPCSFSFCTGITPIAGFAGMSSEDKGLAGTFILDGVTTNYLFGPGLRDGAELGIDFTLTAFSTIGNPGLVTLMTPFTATAGFFMQGINGDHTFIMIGGGIATINLSLVFPNFPNGSPAVYRLQSAHYDFVNVPEPGTAVLILIGLIGCSAIAFAHRVKIGLPPRRIASNICAARAVSNDIAIYEWRRSERRWTVQETVEKATGLLIKKGGSPGKT